MEPVELYYPFLFEYNELMQQMLNTNAAYLALAVTIIFATGGAFYFFNIKPFQEKIAKAEEKLTSMTEENKKVSLKIKDTIQTLDERHAELSDSLDSLKDATKNEVSEAIENIQEKMKKDIESMKEDFQLDINQLTIDYHRNRGQVGAANKYLDQILSYKKKGWKKMLTQLLNEFRDYLQEEGIAEYYTEKANKIINELEDNDDLKKEILKLIKDKEYPMGKDKE